MSQIEATFVVEPYDITITQTSANINVAPVVTDLNIFTAGYSNPAGNNGELQYNAGGILGGVPIATYVNGNINFSNVTNVKLPGGSNAYFLQTDGTGNLTWAPGTVNANTGNGVAVGANTQIQITDGTGNFVSAAGFTFNYVSNALTSPGDAFFTGNINSGNANLGNAAVANYFIGNGAFLTGIDTSKISNGSANVRTFFNANVTISAGGNANVLTVSNTGISLTGNVISILNLDQNLVVSGTTVIQQGKEKITINNVSSNGIINFDVLNQAIIYNSANASNNFTLNFRGNSSITLDTFMNNNQSVTVRFINKNGSTGYYANVIQIDSVTVIPLWLVPAGTPTTGLPNGTDIYDFEIIKTNSNSYTIFGSKAGYQ